ncbi:protein YpmA [Jeotgalibacillus malaysiensis]|uniref:Protein YpmA n=1 Tax=Jeotgalibacillus malaysiensis TaxID=1508404 RepID=A0A0B5AM24_9BACL|nr:protein YpmA [Jeotgalibacillus malaysiensis]
MKEVNLMGEKIEIISTVTVDHSKDLYKIVDALNRSLKRDDLMFGLALDQNDQSKAVFTIYRT